METQMKRFISMVLFLMLATGLPQHAVGSKGAPCVHQIDSTWVGRDTIPPLPPVVRLKSVSRGHGPIVLNDSLTIVSLREGDGGIHLQISREIGSNEIRELGYRFEIMDGLLPKQFLLPEKTVCLHGTWAEPMKAEYPLTLSWMDGRHDYQEPFDFRMVIVSVDRAGNLSPPSDTLRVQHPGG